MMSNVMSITLVCSYGSPLLFTRNDVSYVVGIGIPNGIVFR